MTPSCHSYQASSSGVGVMWGALTKNQEHDHGLYTQCFNLSQAHYPLNYMYLTTFYYSLYGAFILLKLYWKLLFIFSKELPFNSMVFPEKRRRLARMAELTKQRQRLQGDLLERAFERAQDQLSLVYRKRRVEVKVRNHFCYTGPSAIFRQKFCL